MTRKAPKDKSHTFELKREMKTLKANDLIKNIHENAIEYVLNYRVGDANTDHFIYWKNFIKLKQLDKKIIKKYNMSRIENESVIKELEHGKY